MYIPEKLTGLVSVIAEQKSQAPDHWTFLPDGISTLMFKMSDDSGLDILKAVKVEPYHSAGHQYCFLSGVCTQPVEVSFQHFHYIGMYLSPIALKALFGISAQDLRDFAMDGSLVVSDLAEIEDRLHTLPSFIERAKWLEEWAYRRIYDTPDLHLALGLSKLAQKIARSGYNFAVENLEQHLGYSRAQTHRIFSEWFGFSPGKYQRLMRFVTVMEKLHQSADSLTAIGLEEGFFDQAHFIRTFKEFTNMTPGEYRKLMTHLPGQLPTL